MWRCRDQAALTSEETSRGATNETSISGRNGHGAITMHQRGPVTGAWTDVKRLYASDPGHDEAFGEEVAIDGDVALAASVVNIIGGVSAGSIHAFRRDPIAGTWSEEQRIDSPKPTANKWFGGALAILGDLLIVGARHTRDANGVATGSACVDRHDPIAGKWNLEAQQFDSDAESGAYFGWSVALDGTTAMIGAPGSTKSLSQWARPSRAQRRPRRCEARRRGESVKRFGEEAQRSGCGVAASTATEGLLG